MTLLLLFNVGESPPPAEPVIDNADLNVFIPYGKEKYIKDIYIPVSSRLTEMIGLSTNSILIDSISIPLRSKLIQDLSVELKSKVLGNSNVMVNSKVVEPISLQTISKIIERVNIEASGKVGVKNLYKKLLIDLAKNELID